MDIIDNYEAYLDLAIQTKSKYETLLNQLDYTKKNKEELKQKIDESYSNLRIYEASIDYLKKIIDLLSRKHINHLETLLNSAVQTIFYDKDYSIEFEISEFRNNNNLTIYLLDTQKDGTIIKTDIKNNRISVLKVSFGLVLQVYFIIYHNQSRILVMDESLSAISTNYIEYVKSFLDSLTKEYGFYFILINHDPRWSDLADRIYEMKDGNLKLIS